MPQSKIWYPGFRFSKLPPFNLLPDSAAEKLIIPMNAVAHLKATCGYSPLPCTRSGGEYTYGQPFGLPFPRDSGERTERGESKDQKQGLITLDGRGYFGPSAQEVVYRPSERPRVELEGRLPRVSDQGALVATSIESQRFLEAASAGGAGEAALAARGGVAALGEPKVSGEPCGAFHGPATASNSWKVDVYFGTEVDVSTLAGLSEASVSAEVWLSAQWATKAIGVSYGDQSVDRCIPNACKNEEKLLVNVEYSLIGRLTVKASANFSSPTVTADNNNMFHVAVGITDTWEVEIPSAGSTETEHMPAPPTPPDQLPI